MGVISSIAGAGLKFVSPLYNWAVRKPRLADAELEDLRKQINTLLSHITQSSVEAQTAVRGSPNDPKTHESIEKAIRLATQVGQELATLTAMRSITDRPPVVLVEARTRYRAVVAEEGNGEFVELAQREVLCNSIEEVCEALSREIANYVFATWGIGVGHRAGGIRGRRLPR